MPFANEAAHYVAEYIARQRLAKLGFTSDLSKLSAFKAEIFCLIDSEIDKLQAEEVKKHRGKQ